MEMVENLILNLLRVKVLINLLKLNYIKNTDLKIVSYRNHPAKKNEKLFTVNEKYDI